MTDREKYLLEINKDNPFRDLKFNYSLHFEKLNIYQDYSLCKASRKEITTLVEDLNRLVEIHSKAWLKKKLEGYKDG